MISVQYFIKSVTGRKHFLKFNFLTEVYLKKNITKIYKNLPNLLTEENHLHFLFQTPAYNAD